MTKWKVLLYSTTVFILASSISGFAFTGFQKEQAIPQRGAIELTQLNIFHDPAVDRRITELQRKIDAGKQAGQLTPAEIYKLQANLDRIKEKVAKYRADGFVTPSERNQLNEMLSTMEERIRTERGDEDVVQGGVIKKRISELQRKIDDGSKAGQLTRDEAYRLQAALNRIKEKDANLMADNVLTDDERFRITQMLNSLEERIRYEKNDSDIVHREAFERRITELKRKIEAGMKSGQLTLDEACRLNSMLIRIKDRDGLFRSDGILTREERMRLNQMLTHLEERIYEERWDADVNHPLFR
jgi:chromosome segregation ATPase